jgi:CubicO group peptidase (beta-lactamase class C family)
MQPSQLATTLDAAIAEHDFSGVVAIRRAEVALYERAAGYADRSNKVANTLETRFGIASGTKFFTALAIGRLIAAGRLEFDTLLKDCVALPFPHYAPEITIRHLLTHTSGIPDYLDEEKITDFDNFSIGVPWYTVFGPRDYLAAFPDEPMKFAPGERFSYSNGGYIVLGVVIEQLTGRRYQEFVAQEVLAPAGMQRSGFFAMNRLPEQTAFGYVKDADGWRTNIYNLPIVGASDGGMYSTLHDLDRLWQAFWAGTIIPPDLVERYARPIVSATSEGPNLAYGHGLWLRQEPDQSQTVYVLGGDAGVSFRSSMNRTTGLHVTVISNTSDGAWPILRAIEAAFA